MQNISIHALREEGDSAITRRWSPMAISIHALREEGDDDAKPDDLRHMKFLSTPSARRATFFPRILLTSGSFLSTPSARRAT